MRALFLCVVCVFLFGCSTTEMIQTRYDAKTGKAERLIYTKFYDAGTWLEEGKLGLQLIVEHEKSTVPILYPFQSATGTLGPSDFNAEGEVTLVFWNFESQRRVIKVHKVTNLHRQRSTVIPKTIEADGQKQTGLKMGRFGIYNYAIELKVVIDYEIDGVEGTKEFLAKRRTQEEMISFFGPNGRPPYPWYELPETQKK